MTNRPSTLRLIPLHGLPEITPGSDLAALVQLAADAAWTHGSAADRFRASGSAGPLLAVDLIAAMSHAQATTL